MIVVDATNLETAKSFIRNSSTKPSKIRVDIKGWVRIKRDIRALSWVRETPYTMLPKAERWLWHQKKALMKNTTILVLGIPVVRIDNNEQFGS